MQDLLVCACAVQCIDGTSCIPAINLGHLHLHAFLCVLCRLFTKGSDCFRTIVEF